MSLIVGNLLPVHGPCKFAECVAYVLLQIFLLANRDHASHCGCLPIRSRSSTRVIFISRSVQGGRITSRSAKRRRYQTPPNETSEDKVDNLKGNKPWRLSLAERRCTTHGRETRWRESRAKLTASAAEGHRRNRTLRPPSLLVKGDGISAWLAARRLREKHERRFFSR